MARFDLDPKFPLKKAVDSKPAGNQHTLVILFDIASSWRWLPNNRLQLLDVMSRSAVQNGDSIFSDAFHESERSLVRERELSLLYNIPYVLYSGGA